MNMPFCINCDRNVKNYVVTNKEVLFTPHSKAKYNELIATCPYCKEELYVDYINDENCQRRKRALNLPLKPVNVMPGRDERPVGYCPTCGAHISSNSNRCSCGQRIDWPLSLYTKPCYWCEGDDCICTNDASPYCVDYCPINEYPLTCIFYKGDKTND